MGLPLEKTTPITEVIESTVDRITETLQVLGPLAEQTISDATRSVDPDTSVATTTLNITRFWQAFSEQMALSVERAASNLTLLTHDEVPVVEWVSQTPVDVPGNPPPMGWTFRVTSLVSSEGRTISDREVTFTRLNGQVIDRSNPVTPADWESRVLIRVRTWGWVPTGPIAGTIRPVLLGLAAGPPAPVYCALG